MIKPSMPSHWLAVDRSVESPNADERPSDAEINLLVIHNISLPPNAFEGDFVEQLFTNRLDANQHPYFLSIADLRVSAHLYVQRCGRVTQFVALDRRAWHAGVSSFYGVEACNDYSIGIELQGADHIPYTEHQYRALERLTRAIRQSYPAITADRIVGHSDISPGRKTDPGDAFDWQHYLACL